MAVLQAPVATVILNIYTEKARNIKTARILMWPLLWRYEQLENWRWKVKFPKTNRFGRHLAWARSRSSNKGNFHFKFHRIVNCSYLQQKILHLGNTRLSCMCVIKENHYYTNGMRQYHGCCQYHEFMSILWLKSIPWVAFYTMSPCLYHEFMSIPWVSVYTMRPCVYFESLPITCIHVYTMSPCY